MTTYIAYLVKFIFRIKWWLILCPVLVAWIVFNVMGRQARMFRSSTTIYTGLVSSYNLETGETTSQDWNTINNTIDNLINIIHSQATLKNVSMRLYAQHMTYGNEQKDTKYISAEHYRYVLKPTPADVLALIDRANDSITLKNVRAYEVASHDNHIYGLFHWTHRYYSYEALNKIQVKRIGSSDMLEVSYENDDPAIVYNTLVLLNEEFVKQYRDLQFGETNNVIAFFEGELRRVSRELNDKEDSLRNYNVANQVINYDEQTKHIAILSRDFELKNEEIRLNLSGSEQLRTTIESQLEGLRAYHNNANFIQKLRSIGDLQSRITAAEAFSISDAGETQSTADLRKRLTVETDSLRKITSAISVQSYTKEGVSTASMIQQWLDAVLLATKSRAQMSVMTDWKKSLDLRYEQYAPVGSMLKRKGREIGFSEQSYLSILHALNMARLRQKNLQMSSATLKIINPPILPINAEPTKRLMMVAAAALCTFVFVLGLFILLELLDRTLRDKIRAERITGGRIIGAMPGVGRFGERRFTEEYRLIAARYLCNAAINYFDPAQHHNIINILSTEEGDGKSTLCEMMAAHYREAGMKVRIISWNKDFRVDQKDYLLAKHLTDFVKDKEGDLPVAEADLLLVEYPPLSEYSIPKDLLQSVALNIVVAPANRTWKETDQLLYDKVVKLAQADFGAENKPAPVTLCLNYASRDTVQTFTGLLPPYTRLRKFSYQIGQFGFTAVK